MVAIKTIPIVPGSLIKHALMYENTALIITNKAITKNRSIGVYFFTNKINATMF
jgi:hypothetical protein